MRNIASFLKLILAVALIWFAVLAGLFGAMTTSLALSVVILIIGMTALIGGAWLTVYLLRRDAHIDLLTPFVVMLVLGGLIVFSMIDGINWFKGF